MKCSTPYCRKQRAKRRTVCYKCNSQRFKFLHPEGYFYNLFRCNAKRRGKEFLITLAEFKEFCNETGYIELKGKQPDSMTIDRIDSSKGYSKDNIQILSHLRNSTKRNFDDVPF